MMDFEQRSIAELDRQEKERKNRKAGITMLLIFLASPFVFIGGFLMAAISGL